MAPLAWCSRPTAGAWRSSSRRGSSHALPWRTSNARSWRLGRALGALDRVESGRHRLQPRGRAVDRLAGGRRTARAHGARCRPPRSGARQRRWCCPGSASCCLRVRPPSQAPSASNPCRSTEDRGRWWSSERGLPCGRPRATCSSRGTVRCWRWLSTRARERRAARPSRFMPAARSSRSPPVNWH